jgi:ATP-dependent Clp protease ATP-binding subunit ClpA
LADAQGGSVDARHSVFIMTSNVGSDKINKGQFGFKATDEQPDYSGFLKSSGFRQEFTNRIDEVIVFRSLDDETLGRILDLQLSELHGRLAHQKLTLRLNEEARAFLLSEGSDAVNGARPLRRAIDRLLTRPLSARIVEDAFASGDTILVERDGTRLKFEVEAKSR